MWGRGNASVWQISHIFLLFVIIFSHFVTQRCVNENRSEFGQRLFFENQGYFYRNLIHFELKVSQILNSFERTFNVSNYLILMSCDCVIYEHTLLNLNFLCVFGLRWKQKNDFLRKL